jgi:hypothetical protein
METALARIQIKLVKKYEQDDDCKGNLTNLRRILHLSLAKGNPK